MKLSEAIVELEKAIKEHGDIELCDEYCAQLSQVDTLQIEELNGNNVAVFYS